MRQKSTKTYIDGLSGSDLGNSLKILETFAAICEKKTVAFRVSTTGFSAK